jgi:hypothetical protein
LLKEAPNNQRVTGKIGMIKARRRPPLDHDTKERNAMPPWSVALWVLQAGPDSGGDATEVCSDLP